MHHVFPECQVLDNPTTLCYTTPVTDPLTDEEPKPGPSTMPPGRSSMRGRGRGRVVKPSNLHDISDTKSIILTLLMRICRKVKPGKQFTLRLALMPTAQSFVHNEPAHSTSPMCRPTPQTMHYNQCCQPPVDLRAARKNKAPLFVSVNACSKGKVAVKMVVICSDQNCACAIPEITEKIRF